MGACSITSKTFLLIIGLIFWGAAAALFFVAAHVFLQYSHYEEIAKALYTLIPASIIIGVGVLMFLIGLFGCIGALKENKCLLATFFTCLLLVLTAEIAAAALGYVYRTEVEDGLKDGINRGMDEYGNSTYSVLTREVDFMQTELTCCGLHNYTDWFDTQWFSNHSNELPPSCCHKGFSNCTVTDDHVMKPTFPNRTYQQGCYDRMENIFSGNLVTIAVVSGAFAVIQLLGMICSCVLLCRSQEVPYLSLTSSGGYRV